MSNSGQSDSNGDGVGDACESDYDGDGVNDVDDICPYSNVLHTTSFADYISVELDSSLTDQDSPSWILTDSVSLIGFQYVMLSTFIITHFFRL